MKRLLLPLLLLNSGLTAVAETEYTPEQLDYFETHVRPNLVKYCYECHSMESGDSRGGLYLDTREGMLEGGSSGSIFEGEFPLFVDAVTWADEDYAMPPKDKMPDDVIEKLVKWFEMGHPDPRERETFHVETTVDIEAGKNHWAYQMPVRPAEKSVDALVANHQAEKGVEPVGEADALSLLRRLTFDLTGLPPTPPEAKAFYQAVKEDREQAIEEKVDALLASPHYGERWGRHWLDVVRFGESAGPMNVVYPYAWRFRNYVIDAFNEDKPYDDLLVEHLAGDLLPSANDEEKQEHLIATGFLAIGPKKQNEKNRQVFHANLIDEQIDTTTRGFLGTTVACARCHDHKFDPIPTADYYALAGIFGSTETLWGTIAGNQNHRTSELLSLPIPDAGISNKDEQELYAQKVEQLRQLREKNNFLRGREGKGKGGDKGAGPRVDETRLEEAGLDKRGLVQIKQQIMRLQSELEFLNPDGSAKTFTMGAREASVQNANILVNGDVNKPAQEVERGFVQVIEVNGAPGLSSDTSGRLELAQWIASPQNPLTARVMVNRIWMYLLGKPIVETMDNFGVTGLPPTNQELLDYLAISFMEDGWSVKKLVREIVMSDAYQRASTYHEGNYAMDPANETNWRANPRQLDAEALRDQMLLVSGQLDRERPNSSLAHEIGDSRLTASKSGRSAVDTFSSMTARYTGRSLYLPNLREAMPDELALFDAPDPMGTTGQRSATNVAPQSLHLMNSELVQRNARAMAKVLESNFDSPQEQVSNAILLSYSRPATEAEVTRSLQFLQEFDPGTPPTPEIQATPSAGPRGRRAAAEGMAEMEGEQPRRGGKGGKGGGNGPRRQQAEEVKQEPAEEEEPMTQEQVKLAAFCQALMMSAEFRMIH